MNIKKTALALVVGAFAGTAFAGGLSPDEQEWVSQFALVKQIGDAIKIPVKARLLRGTPVYVTPAALDYNPETGECTMVLSPNANATAIRILDDYSGQSRADRILAILAHEYGHCVAYKTGFTVPGKVEAKDEAYADVFSVSVMSSVRPASYQNVTKMWYELRVKDVEVKSAGYSSAWLKYAEEIWKSEGEPQDVAATYAVKR